MLKGLNVDAHFGRKAQQQKEAQQYGQKRVSKLREKPFNPNGKNNGSQSQKLINGPQRKQVGLKEPKERNSKLMGSMKAKMGQSRPKVMK